MLRSGSFIVLFFTGWLLSVVLHAVVAVARSLSRYEDRPCRSRTGGLVWPQEQRELSQLPRVGDAAVLP